MNEGDKCPKCKLDNLVTKIDYNDGLGYLICEGCNFNATELED